MDDPTNDELIAFGSELYEYCKKYYIPIKYVFEILNDQKVTPMTRGKAMEYNAYLLLDSLLDKYAWSVQKLNLSAQPGSPDQDISITHRRTGTILSIESKSAVRGSMVSGLKCRVFKEPHFNVKCHRSRSNTKLVATSNDRYEVSVFDVVITNPLNALYKKGTVGENFEIVDNEKLIPILYEYYGVSDEQNLLDRACNDWRFAVSSDIAEGGYLPRTPYVKLIDDPNWHPLNQIEPRLLDIVKSKTRSRR